MRPASGSILFKVSGFTSGSESSFMSVSMLHRRLASVDGVETHDVSLGREGGEEGASAGAEGRKKSRNNGSCVLS